MSERGKERGWRGNVSRATDSERERESDGENERGRARQRGGEKKREGTDCLASLSDRGRIPGLLSRAGSVERWRERGGIESNNSRDVCECESYLREESREQWTVD